VPFIVENLNLMRETHNILLVTNDHVKTLTDLADNTITVSAIDRSTVTVNEMTAVDRELAMHAVASGVDFDHAINDDADLKFFWSTEIVNNPNIGGVAGFTVFAMSIFLMSYWDSKEGSEALVLVAIQIIAYFCLNPYLLSLVDWRNFTTEEAEALLHSSVGLYKGLKSCVVLVLLTTIAAISYGVVQLSLDKGGLRGGEYFVSMLFDSASLTLPFICFGLYTALPLEAVQILASLDSRRGGARREGPALPLRALLPLVPSTLRGGRDGGLPLVGRDAHLLDGLHGPPWLHPLQHLPRREQPSRQEAPVRGPRQACCR
jgi:hypothetical protein